MLVEIIIGALCSLLLIAGVTNPLLAIFHITKNQEKIMLDEKSTCKEIGLKEKSKEILKELYLAYKKNIF